MRLRRACTNERRITYGEQHDRGAGGFEGGVCLFKKTEPCGMRLRRALEKGKRNYEKNQCSDSMF